MKFVSILFLATLSGFHTLNAACSENDVSSCTTAGCFWNAGICKAVQCSLPVCASGCKHTDSVPEYCRDVTDCANYTDQDACNADSKCEQTTGTCGVSEAAKTKCEVPPDEAQQCPDGCDRVSTLRCEPQLETPTCEQYETETLTSCTIHGCSWETTTGKCVGREDCSEYDDSPASECKYYVDGFCKVSGSSCVMDTTLMQQCNEISVEEVSSKCERSSYCQIKNEACVPAEEYILDCGNYSTEINDPEGPQISECEIQSPDCQINGSECVKVEHDRYGCWSLSTDNNIYACSLAATGGMCVQKNGNCVFEGQEMCDFYGDNDDCLEAYPFCKLSGGQCVYDANACGSLSTEPLTECTYNYDYICKVVTSGEGKQCKAQTGEEYCSKLSVVSGTSSACATFSAYGFCEIGESGVCVPRVPQCRLNAQGTDCDPNNSPTDRCGTKNVYSCGNADCSLKDTEDSCTSLNINGGSAGCEWNTNGTCVTKNPCNLLSSGTCSSTDDCTLIEEIVESCNQDSAITDTTCGVLANTACGQADGCAWASTGGSCVEKSCSNSPSYALCCNGNPSCGYCTSISVPPPDCPPDCTATPDAAGCGSGSPESPSPPSSALNFYFNGHAIAPAALVLAVLAVLFVTGFY